MAPVAKDITKIMDLKKLRSFIAVAEFSNFSEAAEHLYMCQSALSRQISNLEDELGVKLFIRSNRSVKMSPAGQVLYNEAKNLIVKIEDIVEKTRKANEGMHGRLRIGYTGIEKSILPLVIRKFHMHYPDIVLDVRFCNNSSLHESILHGTLDIGCMLEFAGQKIAGISTQHLFEDKLCLVLSKDHPLAAKENLSFSDLENEPFLFFSMSNGPAEYEDTIRLFLQHGVNPKIIECSSDLESLLVQVESGIGVTVLMHNVAAALGHKLKFVPIDSEDASVKVCIAWNSRNQNPCLGLFIETVRNISAANLIQLHDSQMQKAVSC